MRRNAILIFVFAVAAVAFLGWQLFGSHSVPKGQPAMVKLDEGTLGQFERSFDDPQGVRVLALLSPT